MIGISALLLLLAKDGSVGRLEGLVLVAAAVAYTIWAIRTGRRDRRTGAVKASGDPPAPRLRRPAAALAVNIGLALAGLFVLVVGARWFVDGAIALARAMGLSEVVIGLTVVAAGTSLPEVATSVLAALRGQKDIAVGNVVGSNICNVLAILGLSAAVAADGLPVADAMIRFDIPVMIAVAVACLPVFFTGFEIRRWEGALFVFYYVAYTGYLVLDATKHDALGTYGLAFRAFVLPLTSVTLIVLAGEAYVRHRRAGRA
jgi:cation:H+ antiporter